MWFLEKPKIFRRNVLKYIFIYYIPSGLFVVASWAGFLIPPEKADIRMALLITLFLVLINIFNTVTDQAPNVSGISAIVAWMIVCIFFVFAALLGLSYFLWAMKNSCLKSRGCKMTSEYSEAETEEDLVAMKKKNELKWAKIDDVFLIVFPMAFLVFNVFYWTFVIQKASAGFETSG